MKKRFRISSHFACNVYRLCCKTSLRRRALIHSHSRSRARHGTHHSRRVAGPCDLHWRPPGLPKNATFVPHQAQSAEGPTEVAGAEWGFAQETTFAQKWLGLPIKGAGVGQSRAGAVPQGRGMGKAAYLCGCDLNEGWTQRIACDSFRVLQSKIRAFKARTDARIRPRIASGYGTPDRTGPARGVQRFERAAPPRVSIGTERPKGGGTG
jgi:hypothetical protein